MEKKPIEKYFPVHEVNEIAEKEALSKMYYSPVYTMHKWWARRLGSVFRTIILYSLFDDHTKIYDPFYKSWKLINKKIELKKIWDNFYLSDVNLGNKIILDPFFGGGTTIVEALRMGCKVIGKELNPVAWFITKKEIEPIPLKKYDEMFEKLKNEISNEILKYYKTICPFCKNEAEVINFFWVKEINCLTCEEIVPLFKDYRIAKLRSSEVENKCLIRCESCLEFYNPLEKIICPSCNQKFIHSHYIQIFCPQCGEIFGTNNYKENNKCPDCEFVFNPSVGNSSGQYYICSKGHKRKIIESIDRNGKPKERLYTVEYYCINCDKKGYKKTEEKDLELFDKAKNEYFKIKNSLQIPQSKIPIGYNTKQIINYGYNHFQDLFNERQLLNLGKLLNQILQIDDQNLKEHYLLLFSDSLRYNTSNMYNHNKNHILNYFKGHVYHPAVSPIRNNVWGTKYGTGSFFHQFNKYRKGLLYLLSPFEKYRKNDKTLEKPMYNKIEGRFAKDFEDLIKDNKNILLLNGSSEYLEIPDNSVDFVITDPPYYDNVMYSELSDFFYIWLREGLKDKYKFFRAELTPKRAEIVKNAFQNKGNKEFTDGLINVFRECHKKLKDDGLLVFTFHHKGVEAWVSILKTILSSNFYVSAVYPIQAEMKTSTHIIYKANIEYDMIIICRKRLEEPKKVEWQKLQDDIFLNVEATIIGLGSSSNITDGDKFVIAMGKCLEIYSKYWPEVFNGNKLVKIEEAVEDIKNIVDNYFNKVRFSTLEKETDRITAIYLQFLANNKIIDYNELNKAFQQRNLNINEIFEKKLAIKEKNKVKIITYNNRKEYLENLSQDNMIAIDQVHYILNLKDVGKFTKIDLNWIKDEALIVLKRLNVKDSDKLIKYIKKARTQKRIEL